MFIHILNSNSKITNLTEECIQPNAVDLVINVLYERVRHGNKASILRNKTIHSDFRPCPMSAAFINTPITRHPLSPDASDPFDLGVSEQGWILQPRSFYQFDTIHDVEIGEGEMGWLIARSSLVRNGLLVSSGVYDSGFRGRVGGVIQNPSDQEVFIERGARVAQLVLTKAESIKKYDGQYQDKGVV